MTYLSKDMKESWISWWNDVDDEENQSRQFKTKCMDAKVECMLHIQGI